MHIRLELSNYSSVGFVFGDVDMELNNLKEIIEENSGLYQIFKGCPYEILIQWESSEYKAGTVISARERKVIISISLSKVTSTFTI